LFIKSANINFRTNADQKNHISYFYCLLIELLIPAGKHLFKGERGNSLHSEQRSG